MHTFGVGAFVDLPNFSVVVGGLDGWDESAQAELPEQRLIAAVRADSTLGLSAVRQLRSAPWLEETSSLFEPWAWTGVPVSPMPRWMRCTVCNTLTTIDSGLLELKLEYRPDRSRYVHKSCTKTRGAPPPAMPARFVVACCNGHVDEFPWSEFVHLNSGGRCPAGTPQLRAMDTGSGSRSTDVLVECLACSAKRLMTNAFNENAAAFLPKCRGRHAHLQTFDSDCPHQVRPLLLGASNLWFGVTRSVLSIPASTDPFEQAVSECWPAIDDPEAPITSPAELDFAIKRDVRLRKLRGFPSAQVWQAIERVRSGGTQEEDVDILLPEWRVFANPGSAPESTDFRLGPVTRVEGVPVIASVVPVERLREVVALCGFTRVDAPDSIEASSGEAGTQCAPLARGSLTWLPAAEVRGEGIFVRLDEAIVAEWSRRIAGETSCSALHAAHRRWRERRGLEDLETGWPGTRYVLLHSLAHALIREMSLECGYSTASIRERIYSRDPDGEGKGAMAGLLLYTAAPDSEGTLGGLVAMAQADEFARLLESALRRMELCSADPMCAGHAPSESETTLHNAACHACLFLPETSCERANRYLDRSMLVATVAGRGVELRMRR
jgi:hypothetical protein